MKSNKPYLFIKKSSQRPDNIGIRIYNYFQTKKTD